MEELVGNEEKHLLLDTSVDQYRKFPKIIQNYNNNFESGLGSKPSQNQSMTCLKHEDRPRLMTTDDSRPIKESPEEQEEILVLPANKALCPEFVLSDFSVMNKEVPNINQEDFSQHTIPEYDRRVSYVTSIFKTSTLEQAINDLSIDPTDQFLIELQKNYPCGIQLFELNEILLNSPQQQRLDMPSSLFDKILQLQMTAESSKLPEIVHNRRDYVHITPNETLFVRFSKYREYCYEEVDDFEATLFNEFSVTDVLFNANDKISKAVEEYAIRMATVFKETPNVKLFASKNFTNELRRDSYACSIVRFLREYLQYYQDAIKSQDLEETSEFFCLRDNRSAFHIHQFNTIQPYYLKYNDTLWQLLVRDKSMYSEYFKYEKNFIQFRDRKLLSVMLKKDEEDILTPVDFASWYEKSGMALFDKNLASTSLADEPDKQCYYFPLVSLKYVHTCVAASVTIRNETVQKMESDLAQEIDRFIDENACDLAKGRDGFKAGGLFPYLVEGREHLIRSAQLMIYNGTYRERCYTMKARDADSNNVMNRKNTYFSRHSPSSMNEQVQKKKERKNIPEFENNCNIVEVYFMDYGYAEKVINNFHCKNFIKNYIVHSLILIIRFFTGPSL